MNPELHTAGAVALAAILIQIGHAAQLAQYWPLEEASGSSTAANVVVGGNTGILEGFEPSGAWAADAPVSLSHSTRAIAFSGGPEYVNFQNIHIKDSATVSLWIKPATFDPGDVRLYSQVPYVSPYGGVIRFDPYVTGTIQSIGTDGSWVGVGSLDAVWAGDWTHLAFVYRDGLLTVWINGVAQSEGAVVGFDFDASGFALGARFDLDGVLGGPFGNSFAGFIDDVTIWDGPLAGLSIAQLAAGTAPTAITDVPEPDEPATLVQYWPFEEAPGSYTAANEVAAGNLGVLMESDPGTAWVGGNRPEALAHSTTALAWDGVDDYVNLGNVGLRNQGALSLWINPSDTCLDQPSARLYSLLPAPASYNGIVAMGSLPNAVVLRGTVQVYNNGWHLLAEGGTIQAGRWSHLAFVYAPGRCTLYLDGEPLLSANSGLDFDAAELGLGARLDLEGNLGGPFGTGYGGLMDDVSIWDRPLQPSSIRKLASGVSPKLVVDSPATEPPSIFVQPAGATVLLGTPATLSVVASGARTLAFQWEQDGQPVDGATGSTLTFPAVALADDGEYRVVVSNQYGTATSRVARLFVDPGVPIIVAQPEGQTKRVGAEATFTVQASGALPLTFQWHKDGQAITGATEPTCHIAAVSAADAGAYTVVVRNVSGAVTSEVANLVLVFTPPGVNVNLAVASGQNVYAGAAAAPDPGTVWNQVTESDLTSAPDRTLALVDSDGVSSSIGFTSVSFGDPGSALFANNGGGNALQATYWHSGAGNETPPFGFTNLDPAVRYDVYVYGIATDFGLGYTQRVNRVGGESQALNQVVNTGFPILHEDYALFRDVTGVMEVMFTAGELGNGAVFSTVTGLQLIPATDTPKIVQPPTGRFVRQGASVTFTVVATGTAPFTYQWRKNGEAIPGATGDRYVIASTRSDDEGFYSVVVSNAAGSVTSEAARLTLQTVPPAVNINLIVAAGSSEYAGVAAAPDVGTVWNQVTEETLRADANREMALVDSDGVPVNARFFSGSFGEPLSGWFAENGGGNLLQRSYWHFGGGKASPEFGFRNLEAGKSHDVYVYGIATDFNLGWGQAYTLVGGPPQTLKQIPDTGFPVLGEDYVVFKNIGGVTEIKLTSGQAGAFFSTVTGLQLIESAQGVPATLTITRSMTGEIAIGWTGSGVLEQADALAGAWSKVANPANPYTTAPAGAARYYRVVQD